MEDSDRRELSSPEQLAAPHFDDEATLVSARRVVPIGAAKASERSRTIRKTTVFVLAAGLIGVLIGGGVEYYEQRRLENSRVHSQTPWKLAENQSVADPSQIAGQSQPAKVQPESNAAPESPGDSVSQPNDVVADSSNPTSQLRPIHHLTPRVPRNSPRRKETSTAKRGAGRIQEIFAGSPPP